MKEARGNLWDFWENGEWIAITTNGFVKKNGEAVMGRGIALEAKNRFSSLPRILGNAIKEEGNVPFYIMEIRLITFPVKHHWREDADINLIIRSANIIQEEVPEDLDVFVPRPGCGNGRLQWSDVKKSIENILDDRFTVVTF